MEEFTGHVPRLPLVEWPQNGTLMPVRAWLPAKHGPSFKRAR